MLDWIKRIKSAPPDLKVVETEDQSPATEERLERLLVRLGTERSAGADSRAETSEAGSSNVGETSATLESGAAADACAMAVVSPPTGPASSPSVETVASSDSGVSADSSPGIDPAVIAEIAAAVESAVAGNSS